MRGLAPSRKKTSGGSQSSSQIALLAIGAVMFIVALVRLIGYPIY